MAARFHRDATTKGNHHERDAIDNVKSESEYNLAGEAEHGKLPCSSQQLERRALWKLDLTLSFCILLLLCIYSDHMSDATNGLFLIFLKDHPNRGNVLLPKLPGSI